MAKEVERAGRYGYVSVILFDVDHLSSINKEHGYGVGDRILEQLGILVRKYSGNTIGWPGIRKIRWSSC
jgi:GGDEF domain-containing protein